MNDEELLNHRLLALREENEFLRQAAHSFGELAERLANELREVRKHNRAALSATPDAEARVTRTWRRSRPGAMHGSRHNS